MAVPGLKDVVNSVNEENKGKVQKSHDTIKALYGSKGVKGVKRP